jgi:exopolysaccharide biosynthesis polyprenyl glycosylphosphotransferase
MKGGGHAINCYFGIVDAGSPAFRRARVPSVKDAVRPDHAVAPPPRQARASRPVYVLTVLAVDCLALAVAAVVGGANRWWGWSGLGLVVVTLALRGRYRSRIVPSIAHEIPSIIGCVAAPLGLLALAIDRDSTSTALLMVGALAVGLLLVGRMLSYALVRLMRRRRLLFEPTLILGAGSVGEEVARILVAHPEYGLWPVGFLDEFEDVEALPVIGSLARLDDAIEEHAIRRVVIAFGGTRDPDLVPIVRSCDGHAVDIHVVPRFFELGLESTGRDVDSIWGIPLIRLRRAVLRSGAWQVRQAFSFGLAALGLILLSPVYGVVALAVRLSSPGPILFRQRRIGQDGRIFHVLKFRTMRVNKDSDTTWSVKSDRRITPIGRVLRATSLDELPQLINVARGEMALVGPRPERPHFVDRFEANIHGYRYRHRVPAGVTGWAQVNGLRGDTSIRQRARFDNQYIENWSLWEDAIILARTLGEVVRTLFDTATKPFRSGTGGAKSARGRAAGSTSVPPAVGTASGPASHPGRPAARGATGDQG